MPATVTPLDDLPADSAERLAPTPTAAPADPPPEPQEPARGLAGMLENVGDFTLFTVSGIMGALRPAGWQGLMPASYAVGVASAPGAVLAGVLVGMLLAAQTYGQFNAHDLQTRLGAMVVTVMVRELGPLLAAIWMVLRAGTVMTADMAALRGTPLTGAAVHLLVTPRLLACVLMTPLVTALADVAGILGGAAVCIGLYRVDQHYFWQHTIGCLEVWDVTAGLIKSTCFGATIALISCHHGLHAGEGPAGPSRAVTAASLRSFATVLVLDLAVTLVLNGLYGHLGRSAGPKPVPFW